MSVTRLPSGRWRAQVNDRGRNVAVSDLLDARTMRDLGGERGTFPNKTAAKRAREKARDVLRDRARVDVTVSEFWERWTTDPLFARPKRSTNLHNRERTSAFARKYGTLQLNHVGDDEVREWLEGGARNATVPALRAMFNDAASAKAGRLVDRNPFARLGISKGTGRRDHKPPTPEMVADLIRHARVLSGPGFACWLKTACATGLRPGELDALRFDRLDFDAARIRVEEQLSSAGGFTLPKNGRRREAPMTPDARDALIEARDLYGGQGFCFRPPQAAHFTAGARAYHWKAVKAAADWDGALYLSTRHYAGWYMVNVLELPSEDVAIALGHEDGGELVRRLYGHREKDRALDRVQRAYEGADRLVPLRKIEGGAR